MGLSRSVGSDAAGVDDAFEAQPSCGLKGIYSADYINSGSQRWVRLAGWGLKRGKMNDIGNVGLAHRGHQMVKIRDVALGKVNRCQLIGVHDQLQPVGVSGQIVGRDFDLIIDEVADYPSANAAEGTGDKKLLFMGNTFSV